MAVYQKQGNPNNKIDRDTSKETPGRWKPEIHRKPNHTLNLDAECSACVSPSPHPEFGHATGLLGVELRFRIWGLGGPGLRVEGI